MAAVNSTVSPGPPSHCPLRVGLFCWVSLRLSALRSCFPFPGLQLQPSPKARSLGVPNASHCPAWPTQQADPSASSVSQSVCFPASSLSPSDLFPCPSSGGRRCRPRGSPPSCPAQAPVPPPLLPEHPQQCQPLPNILGWLRGLTCHGLALTSCIQTHNAHEICESLVPRCPQTCPLSLCPAVPSVLGALLLHSCHARWHVRLLPACQVRRSVGARLPRCAPCR